MRRERLGGDRGQAGAWTFIAIFAIGAAVISSIHGYALEGTETGDLRTDIEEDVEAAGLRIADLKVRARLVPIAAWDHLTPFIDNRPEESHDIDLSLLVGTCVVHLSNDPPVAGQLPIILRYYPFLENADYGRWAVDTQQPSLSEPYESKQVVDLELGLQEADLMALLQETPSACS